MQGEACAARLADMKLGVELVTKLDTERVRFLYFFFGFSKIGASMRSAMGWFFLRGRGLRASRSPLHCRLVHVA
jgi:hypothetical protein